MTAAVTAIIVASGLTAYLLQQADAGDPDFAVLEPAPQTTAGAHVSPQQTMPAQAGDLVTAPPLRRVLPVRPGGAANDGVAATSVMGAAPACLNCGVVETVVAVHEHDQARGYQMHIRMDDGTVRTVQHRGALAAGSRVAVEGAKLRPLAAP